jgi:hypothetical protein
MINNINDLTYPQDFLDVFYEFGDPNGMIEIQVEDSGTGIK